MSEDDPFSEILGLAAVRKRMLSPSGRRVIKSGRSVEEINAAAKAGFRPLVKPVRPGKDVYAELDVYQDPESGMIHVPGDRRFPGPGVPVIRNVQYYPYRFPNPFAAYLVPKDISVNEEVWLEDLIEDLVGFRGPQGNERLRAAPAVWNGSDFEILFDPRRDADEWVG
ncbi:MAG: hypothetical protein JNN18_22095 [Rubrivivax sp.]|nr:hypothetical protein [Rubrivivax sp.]